MSSEAKPKRGVSIALVVIFLIVIGGVGTVQCAVAIARGEAPAILGLFRHTPSEANLRIMEKALDDESWVQQGVRPAMHYARYRALDTLGPKALAGRDGWLFYAPGIEYLVEPWPPRKTPAGFNIAVAADALPDGSIDALGTIVSFRDQLAERGIELLVVPMPGKARVYPEYLTSRSVADEELGRHTHALMDGLREHNVHVLDLLEIFRHEEQTGDPLFLKQDTHWSPRGTEVAARAVAQRLLIAGWVALGDVAYNVEDVVVERSGDLVAMTRVPAIEASFASETVVCRRVIAPDGEPYQDTDTSKVLVLGDSFLRIYQTDEPGSAGLTAHLARELRQPVASIINDGGATTLVRQVLVRQPQRLHGKSVVVWEFVERDIRFGERGWEPLTLR